MSISVSKFFTVTIFVIAMMYIILKTTKQKESICEKKDETEKESFVYDPDGSYTEYRVRQKLKTLFGIRPAISVLLPTGDMTTEIDLVQATTKGVLVVECKSRNDHVVGHAKSDYWEVGTGKIPMENPIKQNFYHVNAVKGYLRKCLGEELDEIPMINLTVILSKQTDISGLDMVDGAKCFTSIQEMDILKNLPDIITKEKAAKLQELLYEKEGTVEELRKHAEAVNQKYGA